MLNIVNKNLCQYNAIDLKPNKYQDYLQMPSVSKMKQDQPIQLLTKKLNMEFSTKIDAGENWQPHVFEMSISYIVDNQLFIDDVLYVHPLIFRINGITPT